MSTEMQSGLNSLQRRHLGDLENRTAHPVHRVRVCSRPGALSTYSHRLVSAIDCHAHETVHHSGASLYTNALPNHFPFSTTYKANKQKQKKQD